MGSKAWRLLVLCWLVGLIAVLMFLGYVWLSSYSPSPRLQEQARIRVTMSASSGPLDQVLRQGGGWTRLTYPKDPAVVYILDYPVQGYDQGAVGRCLQQLAAVERNQLPFTFSSSIEKTADGKEYYELMWVKQR